MSENTLLSFLKTLTSDELDLYILDLVSLNLSEKEIVDKLLVKISEVNRNDKL